MLPPRKVRITIKVSPKLTRYQKDKILGDMYRAESNGGESFTEWKMRKSEELKAQNSNNSDDENVHGVEIVIRKKDNKEREDNQQIRSWP